jgi:hypothetical protein
MGIEFPLGPRDGLVPAVDAWTWPHWVPGHEAQRVLLTKLPDLYVSTIDVGFDPRGEDAPGPPLRWETLVLGGPLHRYEELHASREEAIERHEQLVQTCLAMIAAEAS